MGADLSREQTLQSATDNITGREQILEKTWGKNVFGIFRRLNSIFGASRVDFRTGHHLLHILDPTEARET